MLISTSLTGEAWSIIIPINSVDASPPELLVNHHVSIVVHELKYHVGQAFVWGP